MRETGQNGGTVHCIAKKIDTVIPGRLPFLQALPNDFFVAFARRKRALGVIYRFGVRPFQGEVWV